MNFFISNLILGITLAAAVGPVSIETIKRGLRKGFWHAFLVGLGAALADATYLILIYLGLANFLTGYYIKLIIWIFGAIVLIYLGYGGIKEFKTKLDINDKNKSEKNSLLAGYLIALMSPMTFAAWFGIGGSIIGAQKLTGIAGLITFLALVLGVIIWFFILSLLISFSRKFVNEKTLGYVSLIAGIILIIFGLYFGYNAIRLILG